jgi:hypothetical protein
LGLEADGGPLGTARIVLDLSEWGEDTVVVLDEHPLRGPGYQPHNTGWSSGGIRADRARSTGARGWVRL